MQTDQEFSIRLPEELARLVRDKVAAGEYATESAMVSEGLQALLGRDENLESWLLTEAVPAYDALQADPGRARSIEGVRDRLLTERAKLFRD